MSKLLSLWGIYEENNWGLKNTHVLKPQEVNMLHWSLVFLVIAIIAAFLGFSGIAGTATQFAKILFILFLIVWVISFIFGRRPRV
jgi:uncharacterized membrane protein YtjA (UPF0391 family)